MFARRKIGDASLNWIPLAISTEPSLLMSYGLTGLERKIVVCLLFICLFCAWSLCCPLPIRI
jgi:hypothetical protein